ncbi:hypothetical protein BD779DRAFT_197292 [Infundibulicybe gibba]|nr:hypothetical protein BD779DRAFT_197292 [Infundibulicybe gibba]
MPTSSLESLPRNTSPFSIPTQPKRALGSQASLRSQSPVAETSDVPKKVPFGFRQSFSLGGAKNSTLITNRISRTTLPTLRSPTQTQPPAISNLPSFKPPASPSTRGLKTLRLVRPNTSDIISSQTPPQSTVLNPRPHPPFSLSSHHANISSSNYQPGNIHRASISSASVSSDNSLSNNPLLSSTSPIPEHTRETLPNLDETQTTLTSNSLRRLTSLLEPQSAPISHQSSWTSLTRDLLATIIDPQADYQSPRSRSTTKMSMKTRLLISMITLYADRFLLHTLRR